MSRIGVLGAGSWGTTLADLLSRAGHDVCLWAYEPEVVAEIRLHGMNDTYLPGCALSPALRVTNDIGEAVLAADLVLCVTPSHAVRTVLRLAAREIPPEVPVVSATKGLETGTLRRMSEVVAEELPAATVVTLSGPSFAHEVYERQPTAVVAASLDRGAGERTQQAFSTPTFRVYTVRDIVGVELGGALKNVIAIAAGILEGLGLGHNPRAALITRGLAEMTRLGERLGADPRTFAGLAGMGDLVLTATGHLSRNRALGVALGQGIPLEEYRRTHRSVAEGVNTTQAALQLAGRVGVELPITAKVAEVLFEGKPPRDAIAELMERTLRSEVDP